MGIEIDGLARFVAETAWSDIPPAVQAHARLVLQDTLGVMLAGSMQPEVRRLRGALLRGAGTGATVLGRAPAAADVRTAALLNGTAGRSIELCEGHRFVSCQAAVQMLPGILAAGEAAGSTGREMLTALVVGYDVAIRLGAGLTARRLAHQNGQTALIGAVAAGARLRGLDPAETGRALRIAATLVLTPSYTNAVDGATALNVAGGMANHAGVLVPDLALSGYTARDEALEEAFGVLVGDGLRTGGLLDGLGERWEIARNRFRMRACCAPMYGALDAFEACVAELQPRPDDVERIDVATYRFASVMNSPEPGNGFAAHYSFPHVAGALLVLGHARLPAFSESTLHDPVIAALRRRVRMVEDPEMSAQMPVLNRARVTLTLKDGRSTTQHCDSPRGDFQRPYAAGELAGKFRELAGHVVTDEGTAELERLLASFDELASLDAVTGSIRRHSLPDPGT